MKLLNCTVRLGGGITHTVPKTRITELELRLLKAIHGADALVDLKQIGDIEISTKDEYRNLARQYGVKAVESCFDVKLDDFSEWLDSKLAEEEARRFEAPYAQDVPVVVANDFPDIESTDVISDELALATLQYDGNGDPVTDEPVIEKNALEVTQADAPVKGKPKTAITLE